MLLSMRVAWQLKRTKGVARFMLKTDMPRKTFRTFTAWKSPEAMCDFVRTEPHKTAVARFWDWRAEGGGATSEWTGPDVKVTWADVDERLKEPTFRYTRRD